MSDYDVIVIGSGAGGGTLVHRLAGSGKKILLLERGDFLTREPQNWRAEDVFVDGRYQSEDTWYDAKDKQFAPQVHYFVGGATKMFGAALYRLRAEDFGEVQYEDGVSPAWPISYDEMEPYYTQAEELYQVHGARGEDPTEPPASAPYPFPAVSHEPRIQQLSDDLAAAGYRPFHAPCGVMLDEANMPYSTCVRCDDCDGFPCLVHAKSDAEVIAVRPALEHANVTLLTNSEAVALNTDAGGEAVTEVVVERDGERETYSADIVAVSCGAANSAKLLLASATDKHPNGLANGSDQVGRNYMFHNSQAVLALSKEPNPTVFQKTLGLNDFYFAGEEFDHPLGNIQMVGKSQAAMYRGEKPIETKLAPGWSLEKIAAHAVDFWLSTEDLPRPDEPGDAHGRRGNQAELHLLQREAEEGALRQAQVHPRPHRHARGPPSPTSRLPEERDPGGGGRASDRDLPLRHRSRRLGARHELQGPRARQPLRRRHQLLPEHRCRQPGADGDGQRAAGRRPSARSPRRQAAAERDR